MNCPKCGAASGDDWRQCEGDCPMPGSPHYKMYGAVEWTDQDNVISMTQGWALFNNPPEIQRLDEAEVFPDDESAKVFVLEHAATDAVCRKAIKLCYGI
jgi:hypothetical protein